jgi:hypothetical protein
MAEAQLIEFTLQWNEYLDNFLLEADESLQNNLQQLRQNYLKPMEESLKELYSLKSRFEMDHEQTYNSLLTDCRAFVQETKSFTDQKMQEKTVLYKEIENLKMKCFSQVNKEITKINDSGKNSSSNKRKRDQLLKELESL